MKQVTHRTITLVILTLLAMAAVVARAGDINKGYTFTDGERNVTHTKLNNLVDGASINTTFFTGKSAVTNANSADIFLLYSPPRQKRQRRQRTITR